MRRGIFMKRKNLIFSRKGLRSAGSRGTAIIVALILVIIGTMTVGGYISYVTRESRATKKLNDSIKALYIAEAGLERAIGDLLADCSWFDGDINGNAAAGINTDTYVPIDYAPLGSGYAVSFSDGDYLVQIKKVNNSKVILKSTGTLREETRRIEEEVFTPGLFGEGVIGDEGVHLDSNALIDSYNSLAGTYESQEPGTNGNTLTNAIGAGVISLDSNAKIYGDAIVGPGGNPDTDITLESNSEITGAKLAAPNPTELPQVTAPADIPSVAQGHIELGGNDSDTIGGDAASGQYEYIELDSNSSLTINDDVQLQVNGDFSLNSNSEIEISDNVQVVLYVTGAFSLNSNSKIDLGDNATITIYVDGAFSMDSNTSINELGKATTAATLYGTDSLTDVTFKSNSGFYGAIYTRNADFEMDSNASLYGTLIAKSITMKSNAQIHFDEALAGTGPAGGSLQVEAWEEVYE